MSGYPFVARRLQPCDVSKDIPLGLRLPKTAGTRSISFTVPQSALSEVEDPMLLAQVMEHKDQLPATWRQALAALHSAAKDINISMYVYGSLAWQTATGTTYVTEDSDIDLLVRPISLIQASACLMLLDAASRIAILPLDGEMEFPDGRAVAWKELVSDSKQVLVKTASGVELAAKDSVWYQKSWN